MTKAAELAKMGEVITNSQIGGRRNIVINGAMMVAQRGTSTQFSNSNGFVCDRFECSNQTDGAITFSQSTDVPSGQGFINSTKINVDTADTSLAATQHALFQQKVEGLNSSQLMWGTSNAENISVSFWIKSSLTGTFTYYALDESADSQSYVQTFTIDSANTWEKKTFIIEGPTTGGTTDFPITNARSFFTGICLGVGSTHQTSTTGSWHSTANFAASTSSAVKLIGTASANMYVTGWQIELGNQATPFEHRSFGEELALCQRYFVKSFDYSVTPAHGQTAEYEGPLACFANNAGYGTMVNFPVEMRTTPSLSIYNGSAIGGTSGRWAFYNGSWNESTGGTFVASSSKGFTAVVTSSSGMSANNAYLVAGNWTCEAEL